MIPALGLSAQRTAGLPSSTDTLGRHAVTVKGCQVQTFFRERSSRLGGAVRSYPAASSTRRITRFTEPVDTSTVKLSATHSKVVS